VTLNNIEKILISRDLLKSLLTIKFRKHSLC